MSDTIKWDKEKLINTSLEEILSYRDTYEAGSKEWQEWNHRKAKKLEINKPSTKETILYFDSHDVETIPSGFHEIQHLPYLTTKEGKRSELEYNNLQRHLIPYALVRYKKQIFFVLRGNGSGESRLIGLKGFLGGHINPEDADELSLNRTLLMGLKRELHEEAGITDDLIQDVHLIGTIKGDDGVDKDHLGFVYEIELNTNEIYSKEEGILESLWLHQIDLVDHLDEMESWARLIIEQYVLNGHLR
jgi:predicted NUDIX family phosphoesterase